MRCQPHTWSLHPNGLQCVFCARVLDASDEGHKRASVLARIVNAGWHRSLTDQVQALLFPPVVEET